MYTQSLIDPCGLGRRMFLCRMHVLVILEVHSGAHLVLVLQNYCSKKEVVGGTTDTQYW